MMLDGLYAYTGGKPFDAARPCVVFLHGAQHDHSVWILQSRYLAHHGYSVLALDLPGHGRSRGEAERDPGETLPAGQPEPLRPGNRCKHATYSPFPACAEGRHQ